MPYLGTPLGNLDTRYVNVTGDTMTGALTITPAADATSVFLVEQSGGTDVLKVDTTNALVDIGAVGDTTAKAVIGTGAAGTAGLLVKGAASQSADLLQFQNSAGSLLTRVNYLGHIGIGANPGTSYSIRAEKTFNVAGEIVGILAGATNLGGNVTGYSATATAWTASTRGNATGAKMVVKQTGSGTLITAQTLICRTPTAVGAITNAYGLVVEDFSVASNNWAIKTGAGLVEFGDDMTVNGTAKIGDGGTTNYASFAANGDLSFEGTAGLYPRVIAQDAEPAAGTGATQIDSGEVVFWIDTNDGDKCYLMFNYGGALHKKEMDAI